MKIPAERLRSLIPLLLLTIAELILYLFPPLWTPQTQDAGELLYLAYILAHLMWAYAIATHKGKSLGFDLYRLPEILFVFGAALFLFTYFFARNANLSYAQLFAETSGNLNLAPNSRLHRLNALLRFVPLLVLDLVFYFYFRLKKPGQFFRLTGLQGAARWSLLLALGSGILFALSFPSFLSIEGFGGLAFVAMIPLWLILARHSTAWGIFYGVSFGLFQSLIANYWLGTFSYITLQLLAVFFTLEYILFFALILPAARRMRAPHLWFFPVVWVLFDFIRSQGFLGYPWNFLGTSLYQQPLLIQTAALGGVYMVSLFVLLSNGLVLEVLRRFFQWRTEPLRRLSIGWGKSPALPGILLAALWTAVIGYGAWSLHQWESLEADETVRIALIQQNTDPRRFDYEETFETLKALTDQAVVSRPDLVAWSETAFVPNIRKWGALDPEEHYLSRVVRDFRAYQRSIETWLITGNDDYTEHEGPDGRTVQNHYNASVLFSDQGERMDTYHKIHLVPFSEYFPYRDRMPWVYDILKDFDLNLWEKGERRTIFRHPKFSFITPICFEDSFPGEIRRFVGKGADLILNLSNDYWSLTEVEGQQHFANSLFRAVENRRPLARATASGLTAYVSPDGRLRQQAPYYQEAILIADIPIYRGQDSLYLRWGNWLIIVLGLFAALGFMRAFLSPAPSRQE